MSLMGDKVSPGAHIVGALGSGLMKEIGAKTVYFTKGQQGIYFDVNKNVAGITRIEIVKNDENLYDLWIGGQLLKDQTIDIIGNYKNRQDHELSDLIEKAFTTM